MLHCTDHESYDRDVLGWPRDQLPVIADVVLLPTPAEPMSFPSAMSTATGSQSHLQDRPRDHNCAFGGAFFSS